MSFARDAATHDYYDRPAHEYDEWYEGVGLFADRERRGRLEELERFLAEARRVAPELVVVDSALRPGVEPEGWQERVLNDGSRHRVFKRYLSPEQLTAELGAEILHAGRWFVAGRASRVG
ncbi:MAG: hypothetical protein ACRDL6_00995 [Solirubrobacterales bacterium]